MPPFSTVGISAATTGSRTACSAPVNRNRLSYTCARIVDPPPASQFSAGSNEYAVSVARKMSVDSPSCALSAWFPTRETPSDATPAALSKVRRSREDANNGVRELPVSGIVISLPLWFASPSVQRPARILARRHGTLSTLEASGEFIGASSAGRDGAQEREEPVASPLVTIALLCWP